MHLTIFRKLALGFAAPVLLIALGATGAYLILQNIQLRAHLARNQTYPLALTAQRLKVDVIQVQQWLTDISATRGLDGLNDGFDKAAARAESFSAGLARFRDFYREKNDTASLGRVDQIAEAFKSYYTSGRTMAQAYVEQGPSKGNKLMSGFDQAAERLDGALEPLLKERSQELDLAMNGILNSVSRLSLGVLLSGLLALGLSLLITILTARNIVRPIRAAGQAIKTTAQCDLTFQSEQALLGRSDELGSMLRDLQVMRGNLSQVMADLGQTAGTLATSAEELNQGNQNLSNRIQEQASSVEQTSATLSDMTGRVRRVVDQATLASQRSNQAAELAKRGGGVVEQAVQAMVRVSESSRQINNITDLVNEIAFQTNLLALNAAVEAARAGEAGRGFAVVAGEVRNLAGRSAEAARQIQGLIQDSVAKIGQGNELVAKSGQNLAEIIGQVQEVASGVGQIAQETGEISQAIEQINQVVGAIGDAVQQDAALVEETAAVSEAIASEAGRLDTLLGRWCLEEVSTKEPRTALVEPGAPPDRAALKPALP